MIALPSPLHPALVHFPIVLVLLGTALAVVGVFTAGWHVRGFAGALLLLGALGVALAVETGEREAEAIDRTPAIDALLDEHQGWAERTEIAAIVAAVLAVTAMATARFRRTTRLLSVAAAVGAIAASTGVYETGRRGGEMVYTHGAGVIAPAPATPEATAATAPPGRDGAHEP